MRASFPFVEYDCTFKISLASKHGGNIDLTEVARPKNLTLKLWKKNKKGFRKSCKVA